MLSLISFEPSQLSILLLKDTLATDQDIKHLGTCGDCCDSSAMIVQCDGFWNGYEKSQGQESWLLKRMDTLGLMKLQFLEKSNLDITVKWNYFSSLLITFWSL